VAKYLLIESRSPWESGDVSYLFDLARDLAEAGNEVTLFLVQNAVLPARKGAQDHGLAGLSRKVRLLADGFSLRERAIAESGLIPGATVSNIEAVVDLLAGGFRAVWH
jgi:hypothetical protein